MPPPNDDFQAVIDAARRGDDGAWRELYRAHAPAVLGYLRSQRAPNPEDLLGETWLHVVRDLGRFDGDEAGLRSWLLTIAHHRLLDARRAVTRRPAEVQEVAADLEDATPSEGAIDAARLEAEEQLVELLEGVPQRQRSLLYLRYVLDLPQKEVARIMRLSTPAAKMLQARALRSLERRVRELDEALPSDDTRRLDT